MPKDMVDGRVARQTVSRVDETIAERLHAHRLQAGDLVLARRGDVGRFAFIERDETGWLCGTGAMRVHAPDSSVIWPRFLRYAMSSPDVAAWLTRQAVGATMPNLNAGIVAELPISVPGGTLQRHIARLLSGFDALIEANERQIELLEDLARSLYREWFVRLRFPGWKDEKFADTALGSIPESWQVARLNEFVTTQYGFTASANDIPVGPQFLRGMDINKRSYINWSKVPYCVVPDAQIEKFRLDVGDVCVVRMADPGKVGIVERPVDAVFASYLVRFRSKDVRLPPQLLAHYLWDGAYQSWVTGSSTGATRKSASASVLTEPLIAVPTPEVAARFSHDVGALRSKLNGLVEHNAALARARDLVLPRLVTGRLDISQIHLNGEAVA
ncbi:MAG TPA: restriction endonuclease subunit S, partial [Thermoleophilaceae bacterium]